MRTEHASSQLVPTSSAKIFHPLNTVRCVGPAVFKSQLSRDVGCLLDVDDAVVSWSCLPLKLAHGSESCCPDFLVEREDGTAVVVVGPLALPEWLRAAIGSSGRRLEMYARNDLPVIRLRNAKDILRYARYDVPLDDRVRLLAALDENGSLTVAESMTVFRSIPPIAGLASLVLSRFVSIDLDSAPIGPETTVRRIRF